MAFPLIPLISALAPLLTGRKVEKVVGGLKVVEKVSDGLLKSKTANVAHGALLAKLIGVWALPLDSKLHWILSAVVLVEWAVNIYLRIKTKTEI